MAFDSFMGSAPDPFDLSTPAQLPDVGISGLGNTEMVDFPKSSSAMDITNEPHTKQTFGLSGLSSPAKKSRLGVINWKKSDTLMVGGAFFAAGLLSKILFDRYIK